MPATIQTVKPKQNSDDFWGIEHLPDVLEVWGAKLPVSLQEIETAIADWKTAGRIPEVCYMGRGRVGSGYGEYAMLGSRKGDGVLDGQVFALTCFGAEETAAFAERYQIKLF